MSRNYTLDEIDSMRQSIEWSYPCGVPFYQEQRTKEIEERIRTYMAAGIEPKELADRTKAMLAEQQNAPNQRLYGSSRV